MKKLKIVLFLIFVAVITSQAQDPEASGQNDSLIVESQDTVLIKSYATRYNPRKALLYAAVVPGLGQIYNKKYWKLPLVYGGFGAIGYAINTYNKSYKEYKFLLFRNLSLGLGENESVPGEPYTTASYRRATDRALRERDFMVIMMGAMYVLQIIDAHVDAHLKEFDLNPNLQVSIEPSFEQNMLTGRQTGVSLVVRF